MDVHPLQTPGLQGVFPFLAVEKPVENVDNCRVPGCEKSEIFILYVNRYSVTFLFLFCKELLGVFLCI